MFAKISHTHAHIDPDPGEAGPRQNSLLIRGVLAATHFCATGASVVSIAVLLM